MFHYLSFCDILFCEKLFVFDFFIEHIKFKFLHEEIIIIVLQIDSLNFKDNL